MPAPFFVQKKGNKMNYQNKSVEAAPSPETSWLAALLDRYFPGRFTGVQIQVTGGALRLVEPGWALARVPRH